MQEVAHQHAGGVAKRLVGGWAATAHGGLIHHIVMQQGGGVDQFHHGCQQVLVRMAVAQRVAHHQQQRGAQTLAARRNDVVGNLTDEGDTGCQALCDDTVHRLHVFGDQSEGIGSKSCCIQGNATKRVANYRKSHSIS